MCFRKIEIKRNFVLLILLKVSKETYVEIMVDLLSWRIFLKADTFK